MLSISLSGSQVTVEDRPEESFVYTSVGECWEAVLDMLKQKIRRRRHLDELDPPPIKVPKSLDGLQMFGLRSPPIIQVHFYWIQIFGWIRARG